MTRVCPRCSTVAETGAADCPHCGAGYLRRRSLAAPIALAVATVAAVLAGVALILSATGDRIDREINDQVSTVQDNVDRSVGRIERRIDRRLGRLNRSGSRAP